LEKKTASDEFFRFQKFMNDSNNFTFLMKQIFEDDSVYFPRIKQFIQNLLYIQPAAIDCEC
jgi:hypothetical protein